jgi:hypothetical protein
LNQTQVSNNLEEKKKLEKKTNTNLKFLNNFQNIIEIAIIVSKN